MELAGADRPAPRSSASRGTDQASTPHSPTHANPSCEGFRRLLLPFGDEERDGGVVEQRPDAGGKIRPHGHALRLLVLLHHGERLVGLQPGEPRLLPAAIEERDVQARAERAAPPSPMFSSRGLTTSSAPVLSTLRSFAALMVGSLRPLFRRSARCRRGNARRAFKNARRVLALRSHISPVKGGWPFAALSSDALSFATVATR